MFNKISVNKCCKKVFLSLLVCILSALASGFSVSLGNENVKQTIYITSDDGPLAGTSNVIEVMTHERVPVTLFVVGVHYDSTQELKRLIDKARSNPYVEIGNHSYSHASNHYRHFYSDMETVVKDLKKNNKTIDLGKNHVVTRLPGRDVFRIPGLSRDDPYISNDENNIEKFDDNFVYKNGFFLYGWDLEWAHSSHGKPLQTVSELITEIKSKLHNKETALPNKLILLMHDEMFQDCFNGKQMLTELISELRKSNYKFDFIKNYSTQEG